MPDVVEDAVNGAAAYHRSRRLRIWLSIAVVVAVILGAGAFYVSLRINYAQTHRALADAQRATHHANAAAAEAEVAADKAEAALHDQAITRTRLCVFLAKALREAPPDAKADAAALQSAYRCPRVPHS